MRRYHVLAGPTAAGKTAWLAARGSSRSLQVVSADSRQVYQHMDIGTGKPVQSILDTVTHHCLSVVTPGTEFSVFRWLPLAVQAMEAAWAAGAEVWVSGGTGLYIRALLDRLPLGAPPHLGLRQAIERRMALKGPRAVAAELGLSIPDDANPVRVMRGIESACEDKQRAAAIYRWAGLAEPEAKGAGSAEGRGYREALSRLESWVCAGVWVADPGSAALEARIRVRVAAMFAEGLVDEVAELRRLGFGKVSCVANGIAYREALTLLDGGMRLEEALVSAALRTRQYAKRQRTYFRGQGWGLLPAEVALKPQSELPSGPAGPGPGKIAGEFAVRP